MNREAFTNNVLSFEKMLYRISMSILKNERDCEDAVQETILKAFEKLGTLKNDEYFTTWLVRILINVCNRQVKKQSKRTDIQEYQCISTSSSEEVEVRLAVEALPQKIRQVIVLYYIEQFSVKEIKQILKIPEGTVKSRLSRGRSLLKLELS